MAKKWKDLSFDEKKSFLWIAVPIKYNGDGDEVHFYLTEWGQAVTPENIDQAIDYVIKRFERDLWQDNVAKQLLGRLAADDLEGE